MADTAQSAPAAGDSTASGPVPILTNGKATANSTSLIPTPKTPKPKPAGPRPLSRQEQLNKLYSLPAPLRTFPLPTLVPHNPLSLFHILYVWLSQTIKPGAAHIDPIYQGWFSPETRSVHVTDQRAIRGLWEQGFYGKGSLSRSEPSWLKRETTKRKLNKGQTTAEEKTRQRRAERQRSKWERARKEREAIDQKLTEEAEAILAAEHALHKEEVQEIEFALDRTSPVTKPRRIFKAPVGPLELLALPNSKADLIRLEKEFEASEALEQSSDAVEEKPDAEQIQKESNGHANGSSLSPKLQTVGGSQGHEVTKLTDIDEHEVVGGSETNEDTAEGSTHSEDSIETDSTAPNGSAQSNGSASTPTMKRQKSVRFSPTVEKNTFIQTDPPSPQHREEAIEAVEELKELEEEQLIVAEQEHTQLTLEEAFFLSYGLGALEILDPATKEPIPTKELFALFRQNSYFPPLANPSLSPDDPFMLSYVVYHHYRSLGWVARGGIKFSVDLMLYVRGPVFTHAEFGVLILPSYSDPYWTEDVFRQNYVKAKEHRTWHWISCINRVITQVKKTLILTYVDIPPPLAKEEEEKLGIDEILGRYKVREVVLKRWSANRMRD